MSEELIVRHCSPTLAGIKTGSLFSSEYSSEDEVKIYVCRLNKKLVPFGLRVLPIKLGKRALIYVYRPLQLKKTLKGKVAEKLLKELGYKSDNADLCVVQLINRVRSSAEFPHEIGIFLGYPPEDVRCFVENGAKKCKCNGCWKVYGNEKAAKLTFKRYKKCTDIYSARWKNGVSIEQLCVNRADAH